MNLNDEPTNRSGWKIAAGAAAAAAVIGAAGFTFANGNNGTPSALADRISLSDRSPIDASDALQQSTVPVIPGAILTARTTNDSLDSPFDDDVEVTGAAQGGIASVASLDSPAPAATPAPAVAPAASADSPDAVAPQPVASVDSPEPTASATAGVASASIDSPHDSPDATAPAAQPTASGTDSLDSVDDSPDVAQPAPTPDQPTATVMSADSPDDSPVTNGGGGSIDSGDSGDSFDSADNSA